MTTNSKAASPVQAGTLGETASERHANNTTQLTPRHQRIHAALAEVAPKGILSFDLRHKCGCMNIADEVMAMRRLGFNITCELEPFVTVDGVNSRIGRYCLAGGVTHG